ncbi:MAG TPA: hypothetical protein VLL77_12280 [Anaerolineales bacterium]|nr:hypothetical protein [Anaerolineales bacterium]
MTTKKTKKPSESFEVPLFKPKKPTEKPAPAPRPEGFDDPIIGKEPGEGFDDPIIGKDQ